jgi:uncharacterized damage-inducible protein DinB
MSVFTNPASRSTEQAVAYTAAVLDLLGDREPLDVLTETVPALKRAIAGLSDAQLVQPESDGKWSIRHVLQHLADSELVWGWRLRLVLAQDRPSLSGYDQDAWATRLHYDAARPEDALADFSVLRRDHLRLLALANEADFDRVGVHTERGEESVRHMMRLYAGHDLLHLRQIDRIRRALAG